MKIKQVDHVYQLIPCKHAWTLAIFEKMVNKPVFASEVKQSSSDFQL